MSRYESTNYSPMSAGKIAGFVAMILVGVGLALLAAPALFKIVPTDLSRTAVLLQTLQDPPGEPEYVVFGNSVIMQGIDTNELSTYLKGDPLGYNLSSTGQNLLESALYYQELPDSVNTVIQFVQPDLMTGGPMIEPQKYNALYMYGYRPDADTRNLITSVFHTPGEKLLNIGYFEHAFDSRWAVRQAIDTFVRNTVRSDMTLDVARDDLFFPSSRGNAKSEAKLNIDLKRAYEGKADDEYKFVTQGRTQLKLMIERNRREGRRTVIVIPPIHPRAKEYEPAARRDEIHRQFEVFAEMNDVELINTLDAVPAELFIDARHTSVKGAELLTDLVGRELQERGF